MGNSSNRYYGSINFDSLLIAIKSGQVATYKSDKGTRYVNVNIWINAEPNQYGHHGSIQLSNKEEYRNEKSIYIGNLKKAEPKISEATPQDFLDLDDVPF